jgi:hypothetical protein
MPMVVLIATMARFNVPLAAVSTHTTETGLANLTLETQDFFC